MKELADMELLDAYASQRSEEAFRELVARHVDFTYSAALRQLRNPHLAQEATQTAFIALAGKAGRLRRQTVIAGWLHRAVHFAALNLQRSEARRKHWEEEAATMNLSGETELAFEELALPQVDGALAELNETDRDAVILRFLHQRSLRDVGHALGTSEEAAKKRVSRALEKLRGLLARRGITVPAAALAAGLSQLPVTAAPAALPSAIATLAVAAAVPTATMTATFLALLASTKTKLALAAGLIVLAGAIALLRQTRLGNTAETFTNTVGAAMIRIRLTSIPVQDQDKALKFYTEVLRFVVKRDMPAGGGRWLTVVSPDEPDGPELVLEPMGFAPARTFQQALYQAGIPFTALAVEDIQKEYQRMTTLGVVFTMKPTKTGPVTIAVFDDTCGNRIQLVEPPGASSSTSKSAIKITLTSVMVSDQAKALRFYTEVLGFVKKQDMPAGGGRWLTVVSPDELEGPELLLEPLGFAPAKTYQEALHKAGIPWTAFPVGNVQKEYERMTNLGVIFSTKPTQVGPTTIAVFDDTCGNRIQLFQAQ